MGSLPIIATLVCFAAMAEPGTRPAADFVISPTRMQQTGAARLFYTELTATFENFDAVAKPAYEALKAALHESGNRQAGPALIVYHGLPADAVTPFKFQFGILVDDAAREHGAYKVRELPGIRCMSILYSGSVLHIRDAYRQLMTDLAAAGHEMTGEIREIAAYWEGEDSPNNVIILQAGVK